MFDFAYANTMSLIKSGRLASSLILYILSKRKLDICILVPSSDNYLFPRQIQLLSLFSIFGNHAAFKDEKKDSISTMLAPPESNGNRNIFLLIRSRLPQIKQ